ncbi:MAG: WbqC family protein, partial [Bacteroidetes bacterium]|nr:WbqC family protein [Bacteroidota bacterium]
IGYFQLIVAVDIFVIYDDVSFINKGWVNRNNILINGKAGLISVPLNGASQNKLIKDIAPVYEKKWKNTLLKTIEQNYKKAPMYNSVYPLLQKLINDDAETISELNYNGIKVVCDYLNICTKLIPSSVVYGNSDLKGQYRILDICKIENGEHYINPIGGIELYNKQDFANRGLQLNFIQTKKFEYNQFKNEFVPWLSIIDVLMFNSVEEVQIMLDNYELI